MNANVTPSFRSLRWPFVALLLFTVGVFLWSMLQWSLKKREDVKATSEALTEAWHSTLGRYMAAQDSLLLDRTLAQNLSWKLNHSVQGVLSAHMQKPFISAISLWSDSCQMIAKVALTETEKSSCPEVLLKKASELSGVQDQEFGFKKKTYHLESKGHALIFSLAAQLPLVSDNAFVLLQTSFDDKWIKQFPELDRGIMRHGFKLALLSANSTEVFHENLSTPLRLILPEGRLWRLLNLLWLPKVGATLERATACLFFLGFTIVALWVLQFFRMVSSMKEVLIRGQERIDAITVMLLKDQVIAKEEAEVLANRMCTKSEEDGSIDQGAHESRVESYVFYVQELAEILRRRFNDEKYQNNAASMQIKELKTKNSTQTLRILELEHLEAERHQQKVFLKGLTTHFELFRKEMANLLTAVHASAMCADRESLRLKGWEKSLAEKGSRKFIRSLAETAGTEPGKTALDDEITGFIDQMEAHHTLAKVAAHLGLSLEKSMSSIYELTLFWQALATEEEKSFVNGFSFGQELHLWIEKVQSWVALKEDHETFPFRFINRFEATCCPDNGSQHIWLFFLLHVYLILSEDFRGKKASCMTTLFRDGPVMRLVIGAKWGDGTQSQTSSHLQKDVKPIFSKNVSTLAHDLEPLRSRLLTLGIEFFVAPATKEGFEKDSPMVLCSWTPVIQASPQTIKPESSTFSRSTAELSRFDPPELSVS